MKAGLNESEFPLTSNVWHLKKFNIFDNFDKSELESITCIFQLTEFTKHEAIYLPCEPIRRIYFLINGKAKLSKIDENGKELILDILKAGEIFGQLAFPEGHYSNTEVIALERCIIGHIREKDFRNLMKKIPDLCLSTNKLIGTRLLKIENRLEELLFRDVPCRLARLLLRLSDEYPHQITCGLRLDLIVTQQELANLIGSTREMVSTTLNCFKRSGWIDIHSRYICLHDIQAIQNLAK